MSARVLAPYVASLTAYDVLMPGPGTHRGMPGTAMTFVLPLGEPLDVAWAGDRDSRRTAWSCISGLHTIAAEIHHDGRQRGIQLGLTAAGARALLGVPVAALAGELLDLDTLAGEVPQCLVRLPAELAELPDADARIRLVGRRLVEALATTQAPGPRAEVGHALARLSRGAAVQDVAAETGFSRRHLTNLVRAECGLSPKQWQRVARFERSRDRYRRVLATGRGSLADVAAESGYADQAHLSREWNALAGCSPTQWAREEFPNVQAGAVPRQAG